MKPWVVHRVTFTDVLMFPYGEKKPEQRFPNRAAVASLLSAFPSLPIFEFECGDDYSDEYRIVLLSFVRVVLQDFPSLRLVDPGSVAEDGQFSKLQIVRES